MTAIRVPPGRAGRPWLREHLAAAERAADVLEQKVRVLRTEHRQRVTAAEHSAQDWTNAVRDAEEWTLRATLLAGEHGLRQAAPSEQTTVDIEWAALMGVRYPIRADCTWPVPSTTGVTSSAALACARSAYHRAVTAAARHAADDAAVRALATELATTSRRIRALRRRWIPALHDELDRAELALEELDRTEASTHHLARRGNQAPSASTGTGSPTPSR